MPTAREYEAALERNPADTEAFVALRKNYRHAKAHDRLITLYETPGENISFGRGLAQRAHIGDREKVAS